MRLAGRICFILIEDVPILQRQTKLTSSLGEKVRVRWGIHNRLLVATCCRILGTQCIWLRAALQQPIQAARAPFHTDPCLSLNSRERVRDCEIQFKCTTCMILQDLGRFLSSRGVSMLQPAPTSGCSLFTIRKQNAQTSYFCHIFLIQVPPFFRGGCPRPHRARQA